MREEMERLALGAYFAECMEAFGVEEQPEPELLQLGLNSLYALSRGLGSQEKIKAAFELRLMCLTGYTPELTACAVCGKEPEEPVLSLEQGRVCCRSCAHQMGERAELGSNALEAMRYICAAPPKQMLRFELGEDAVLRLSDASEHYLLRRAERGFSALDYWKKIRSF